VIWSMLSSLVACAGSTVSVSRRVGSVTPEKCLGMTLEGVGIENRERKARARDVRERESIEMSRGGPWTGRDADADNQIIWHCAIRSSLHFTSSPSLNPPFFFTPHSDLSFRPFPFPSGCATLRRSWLSLSLPVASPQALSFSPQRPPYPLQLPLPSARAAPMAMDQTPSPCLSSADT
jgi:hypothetical protein